MNHIQKLCSQVFKQSVSYQRNFSVCVVGAGPAGFYCTQNLLKLLPHAAVDIYEKLPVPFGLVRFGVAPDHADVKNVINTFNKTASNPKVRFIGNVSLGKDLTLEELKLSYNVVILTYGADQDMLLNISGEQLPNIVSARRFVGWYNGYPGDKDLDINLHASNVSIIGQGNVAVDIARILLKKVDDLKNTDITEYALAKLSESQVKDVRLIGRRGPLQVAFTIKEFRELSKLQQTTISIDKKYFNDDITKRIVDLPRPRKRLTEFLLSIVSKEVYEPCGTGDKTLHLMFMRSPTQFIGNDRLKKIELGINQFSNTSNHIQDMKIEKSGIVEIIPSDLCFRSIGYRSTKVDPTISFSNENCIGKTKHSPGVYSSGWVSTGPNGVILSTMRNAFETTNLIAQDFQLSALDETQNKPGYREISRILKAKGVIIVDWTGWNRINETEIKRGKALGKPREKIVDLEEMLKIGGRMPSCC